MNKENKKKISWKKPLTIVGISALVVGAIATTYWAAIEFYLRDLENMKYLNFNYSLSNTNPDHVSEVTITGIKGTYAMNDKYPKNFRVPEKLLGMTVTGIGDEAFAGLEKIKTISLPKTITTIGDRAFANCPELKKVNLDSKVLTHVGEGIFEESDAWEGNTQEGMVMFGSMLYKYNGTLNEGTTVKSIDDKVEGEDPLTNVYIGNDVTLIASGAFADQDGLVSFSLPERFDGVSNGLVKGCENLTTFSAPSATSIGQSAFEGCTSLQEFDFSNVDYIGDAAFKSTSLTDVVLKDTMTTIGKSVFEDCKELANIKLPSAIEKIDDYAFAGCNSLTSIETATIAGNQVTNDIDNINFIGVGAFMNTSLKSITLPSKLISIKKDTFSGCEDLTSVILPQIVRSEVGETEKSYNYSGINSIGDGAFRNTKALKSFSIPSLKEDYQKTPESEVIPNVTINTLKSIGEEAFESSGIESFVIPASISNISKRTFRNCSELSSVVFQDPTNSVTVGDIFGGDVINESKMTKIDTSAFENTTKLENIEIPNTVNAIASSAFKNSGLRTLNLPTKLVTINAESFADCVNLQEVTIPSTVNAIKSGAFKDCTALKTVNLGAIKQIEKEAFFGTTDLNINIDLTEVDYTEKYFSKGWNKDWHLIGYSTGDSGVKTPIYATLNFKA